MHGGKSTGPRTIEGLARIKNARTIHARYSAVLLDLRRAIVEERRPTRELFRWADE
jgi:hypothetical protein